jgi:hypothetical protein
VCCVSFELCESVLALECCNSWDMTGLKAVSPVSLMTDAVESEVSNSYFLSFVFDVSSIGRSAA